MRLATLMVSLTNLNPITFADLMADIQARLEGKKVDEAKKGGDSGEKESTLHKVEDKLGMGKK